jgi:hypothetical protein
MVARTLAPAGVRTIISGLRASRACEDRRGNECQSTMSRCCWISPIDSSDTAHSNIWLIGPEQGGGWTKDEVYWRASLWSERGKKETEDLQSYHAALKAIAIANVEASDGGSRAGVLKLSKLDWKRNIQPTWGPLIRVILAFNGERAIPDKKDVMDFQKRELGRADGENCVLDLNPLPSPKQSKWNEAHLSLRCDLLGKKLARHKPSKPRLVLFYSLPHQRWWEQISAHRLTPSKLPPGLSLVRRENTLFAMIPHPNGIRPPGPGAVKRFLADVGMALREELR